MSAKEVFNDTKEAISERLKNPFLGKLILSWLIVNWKTWYITFFIKEDTLKPKTKIQEISEYLSPNNFFDALLIYGLPIFITVALIWWLPYITDEAFKSSEKFRKKKALTKKETDEEINNANHETIERLQNELNISNSQYKNFEKTCNQLICLAKYLAEEIECYNNEEHETKQNQFLYQYRNEILTDSKQERVKSIIEQFHSFGNNDRYFSDIPVAEKNFLFRSGLLENNEGVAILSDFGLFISKNILFEKYQNIIPDLQGYNDLN